MIKTKTFKFRGSLKVYSRLTDALSDAGVVAHRQGRCVVDEYHDGVYVGSIQVDATYVVCKEMLPKIDESDLFETAVDLYERFKPDDAIDMLCHRLEQDGHPHHVAIEKASEAVLRARDAVQARNAIREKV